MLIQIGLMDRLLSKLPQWYDLGFVVRHPKDFDYFRQNPRNIPKQPNIKSRFRRGD